MVMAPRIDQTGFELFSSARAYSFYVGRTVAKPLFLVRSSARPGHDVRTK